MKCIYLDAAATTRCSDVVVAAIVDYCTTHYGNPSSPHSMGIAAKRAVDLATERVAKLVGCSPREITFTAGATESNNIVMLGACFSQNQRANIVACPIDHKSTLEAAAELARRGTEVRWMKVDRDGRVDITHLRQLVDEDTILVTVSYVNSELGTIQDISSIGGMLRSHPAIFHVDATQAVGKLSIDVGAAGIDSLALSAHKICGPKGIGALYVESSVSKRLRPLTFGGGQTFLRSGTLPSELIVALGVAAEHLNSADLSALWRAADVRRAIILETLESYGATYSLNSSPKYSVPHILNIHFPKIRAETIVKGLTNVCVASGSACNSQSMAPSYVLTGVGYGNARAECSVRVSFLADQNEADLREGAQALASKIVDLQRLIPGEYRQ